MASGRQKLIRELSEQGKLKVHETTNARSRCDKNELYFNPSVTKPVAPSVDSM